MGPLAVLVVGVGVVVVVAVQVESCLSSPSFAKHVSLIITSFLRRRPQSYYHAKHGLYQSAIRAGAIRGMAGQEARWVGIVYAPVDPFSTTERV